MSKKPILKHYNELFTQESKAMKGIDISALPSRPRTRLSKRPFYLSAAVAAAIATVLLAGWVFEKQPEVTVSEDFKSETYAMLVNLETNYDMDSWTLWSE